MQLSTVKDHHLILFPALLIPALLISIPIAIVAGNTLQLSVEQHALHLDARLLQALQRDMQIGNGGHAVTHHEEGGTDMRADHGYVRDQQSRRCIHQHNVILAADLIEHLRQPFVQQ